MGGEVGAVMHALLVGEDGREPAPVRHVLARRGYKLTSTDSGLDALRVFREVPVDLIVVDWKPAHAQAASFCRRLRAERGGSSVALLGLVEPESLELDEALSAGVSDYLTRPLSIASVEARIAIVERWLEHLAALRKEVSVHQDAQISASRSEEDFRILMEACPDPIGIHRDRIMLYANPALVAALGYDRADAFVGTHLEHIVHPADRVVVEQRLRTIEETGRPVPVREERFLRVDGSIRVAEAHSFMIRWGETPALVSVGKDVTEKKALEAQLLHSERLSSIGALAAGVAHELNNPLTLVLCNLSDLSRVLPSLTPQVTDKTLDHLERRVRAVEDGVAQVRMLARDLTDFARGGELPLQPIDLRPVLERCVRMLAAHLRDRGVDPVKLTLGDVGAVRANETHITQLVLNLVLNAVDAIEHLPAGLPRCIEIELLEDAGSIVIRVSDSGPGIPRELRERIFTPFFSTKPQGKGTGLGLTVAKTIVERLGGTLGVVEFGQGTAFEARIPPLH